MHSSTAFKFDTAQTELVPGGACNGFVAMRLLGNIIRVKSGNFGQRLNSDNDIVSFISQLFGIKTKVTGQTVKIPMRRLIMSRLIGIFTACNGMSEFTRCPKLHDSTL